MRSRSRTFTGAGIAAAAVAAVLALSGCGSGADDTRKPTAAPTTTAGKTGAAATTTSDAPVATASTPDATDVPTDAPTGDPTRGVEGVWLSTRGSAKVQLVLGKGQAGLTSSHLCGGTYTDKDGLGLTLTCMDGNKDRTSGRGVLAADGKTLTVRWKDGLTDTFFRTSLPSN
ncbi:MULTISPECIES: hypothetical protein [unclassified Streptomyces]|uniref:hypothetical protein n=1 Tax=unclassified Streptomyces TaxID=2593676 RepID=UPI002E27CF46|nr:hypothetical protein [Streptomyces sp. NBC_00223]